MARDPVCGREVNERFAAAMVKYRLATFYFCSESCHKLFGAHPREYAEAADAPERSRSRPSPFASALQ
jgi:Cu+-exporting ATPase